MIIHFRQCYGMNVCVPKTNVCPGVLISNMMELEGSGGGMLITVASAQKSRVLMITSLALKETTRVVSYTPTPHSPASINCDVRAFQEGRQ